MLYNHSAVLLSRLSVSYYRRTYYPLPVDIVREMEAIGRRGEENLPLTQRECLQRRVSTVVEPHMVSAAERALSWLL